MVLGDGSADFTEVVLSLLAVKQFMRLHGVVKADAEAQLASLVEDFFLLSERGRDDRGHWILSRDGYELAFSPALDVLVAYRTVHADRTWAQCRAGVPSRISVAKAKPSSSDSNFELDHGGGGPAAAEHDAIAPGSVEISTKVLTAYAHLLGRAFRDCDPIALQLDARAELAAALRSGPVHLSLSGSQRVVWTDRIWVISRDSSSVIRVEKADSRPQ